MLILVAALPLALALALGLALSLGLWTGLALTLALALGLATVDDSGENAVHRDHRRKKNHHILTGIEGFKWVFVREKNMASTTPFLTPEQKKSLF